MSGSQVTTIHYVFLVLILRPIISLCLQLCCCWSVPRCPLVFSRYPQVPFGKYSQNTDKMKEVRRLITVGLLRKLQLLLTSPSIFIWELWCRYRFCMQRVSFCSIFICSECSWVYDIELCQKPCNLWSICLYFSSDHNFVLIPALRLRHFSYPNLSHILWIFSD